MVCRPQKNQNCYVRPCFFQKFLVFWKLQVQTDLRFDHVLFDQYTTHRVILMENYPFGSVFFRKKTIKKDERLSLTAFSMIACRWSLVAPPVSIIMILQSFPHLMKIDTKWQKVGSRLKLWKFSSYKTTLFSLINVALLDGART